MGRRKKKEEEEERKKQIELQQFLREEQMTLIAEAEIADENAINTLTARPHIDDDIRFAVPVCAPYAALGGFFYRVKIVPGRLKRGKAAKEAIAQAVLQINDARKKREKEAAILRRNGGINGDNGDGSE